MKSLGTVVQTSISGLPARRNLRVLLGMLAVLATLVAVYTAVFHYLMGLEGQPHTLLTGVYWTLVTMSTLGFGDVVFHSDAGRLFSVVVLVTGTVFMLVLLPFTFIQFFYAPWLEAQAAARAPRELPAATAGHVLLAAWGAVDAALVRRLEQHRTPYAVLVPEVAEALALHDQGVRVMVGQLDDPETWRRAHVERAALVAAARADTTNTNVALTVRECSERVPIVATASSSASVDILQLAGCQHVLQLGDMLGRAFARRVFGRDGRCHVVGGFDGLLVAEAAVSGTPLVGLTLREARLPDRVGVNVAGTWDRGRFSLGGPETRLAESAVLFLAGSQAQLDAYDRAFRVARAAPTHVVVIGGGRVGRAAAQALGQEGIDHRIVEKLKERVRDPARYVLGDAAELSVLQQARLDEASSVLVTTHDDDVNVYLTLYCRRLRPDVQLLSRATLERNVSTLHRAGADFVLSYASMGASAVFNILRRGDLLTMAEGLDVFRVRVPPGLAGRSLAESALRQQTGCSVVGVRRGGETVANPDVHAPLDAAAELVLIGDAESERRFLARYAA
jgi:voltage-gated potassium channel